MAKLTQQEIETERKKFIAFNSTTFSGSILYQYDSESKAFISPHINNEFIGWLARAELERGVNNE